MQILRIMLSSISARVTVIIVASLITPVPSKTIAIAIPTIMPSSIARATIWSLNCRSSKYAASDTSFVSDLPGKFWVVFKNHVFLCVSNVNRSNQKQNTTCLPWE